MTKLESTGIRIINFKDSVQEVLDAGFPTLWESVAALAGEWSTGLGAGAMPTTFQGMGGRHLVTAGIATYSRVYTNAPGAFDWWHTDQRQSGNRYAHQYDFMFRVNTSFPGTGHNEGVVFGYFIEHDGTVNFVETAGYRVRFDGTTLFLEKWQGGGWIIFNNTITSAPSSVALALVADKDYYVRITYYPTDAAFISGTTLGTAGGHVVSITDDFERRGANNVGELVVIDPAPLLGSANTKLMIGGYNTIDAEFDLITYSNGFLPKPNYMHYYSQLKRNSTVLTLKWATPNEEPFDLVATGNRVEMWCLSRSTTINMIPPDVGDVERTYNKILCVYDGMVAKIQESDKGQYTTVSVIDEFSMEFGGRKAHEAVTGGGGATYYDYIRTILSEYQGANADRMRVTPYPGVNSVPWGGVLASVASWTHRGSWGTLWEVLSRIVNVWNYWNPAGGFLVSQLAPIVTGKVFNLDSSTGELQWIAGSKRADNKRDSYVNEVAQYHDNGAGVVVATTTSTAADKVLYGTAGVAKIDVNMPTAEGAAASVNLHAQMNDKEDIIDMFTICYGLEFHVGCRVGVTDSHRDMDEANMTVTEVEMFRVDNPEDHDIPMPSSFIRFRLAHQDDPVELAGALPRYEDKKSRWWKDRWQTGEYEDHNWT